MLIVLCLGARFRLNLLSGWQARVSSTDFDTRMQVLIAGEPPALPEYAERFYESAGYGRAYCVEPGVIRELALLSGSAGRWPALEATKYTAT